jgi:hypothetical protein
VWTEVGVAYGQCMLTVHSSNCNVFGLDPMHFGITHSAEKLWSGAMIRTSLQSFAHKAVDKYALCAAALAPFPSFVCFRTN